MNYTKRIDLGALATIFTVGATLTAIHFGIPTSIQKQLALDQSHPEPWMFLTSAYVHNSTQHLVGNLLGFGIGAVVASQLCDLQGRRRWFRVTTGLLLLVLPVLVGLTDFVVFQSQGLEPTTRGFSAVVAGCVGFVLVALARWVADRYGQRIGSNMGLVVFLLLMGEILFIYQNGHLVGLGPLLLLFTGLSLTLGTVVRRVGKKEWRGTKRRRLFVDAGFVVVVTTLLAALVWGLFPAHVVQDGSVTNILAHLAGLGWGISLALIGSLVQPTNA